MLLPLCALVVHQLRFYAAFGSHAPMWLAREGHAYLSVAEPIVLLLAAIAAGGFVGRVARTCQRGAGAEPRRGGLLRIWGLCAIVLFAFYCGQELIEGFVSTGHPAGLAGIVGHGGWTALPFAMLVAAALATALRVADSLVRLAAQARSHPLRTVAALAARFAASPATSDWRLDPRSGVVAGRAPPLAPSR